jgi:hypothetical protein
MRDQVVELVAGLPERLAGLFTASIDVIDEAYRRQTRQVDDPRELSAVLGGDLTTLTSKDWWWHRLPDPEPWRAAPGAPGSSDV